MSRSPLRRNLALAAAAVSLLALSACGGGDSASASSDGGEKPVLIVGQQTQELEPVFEASGVFDDAPFQIKYATFNSPVDNIAALASGKVDVGMVGQWTGIQAIANSKPLPTEDTAKLKIVAIGQQADTEQFDRAKVVATKKSGITSLDEAKGKRWGFIPGSFWDLFHARALQELGWTDEDVETVETDVPGQASTLQTGQVDVSFLTADTASVVGDDVTVLGSASDYALPFNVGLFASADALEGDGTSDLVQEFLVKYAEFQAWQATHPDEIQDALVKERKFTPEAAKVFWEHTRYLVQPITDDIVEQTGGLLDTAVAGGLVPTAIDTGLIYDDRYTDAIAAALEDLDLKSVLQTSVTSG